MIIGVVYRAFRASRVHNRDFRGGYLQRGFKDVIYFGVSYTTLLYGFIFGPIGSGTLGCSRRLREVRKIGVPSCKQDPKSALGLHGSFRK